MDWAKHWLEEMRKDGEEPDEGMFKALIKGAESEGDGKGAREWATQMEEAGFSSSSKVVKTDVHVKKRF